MKRAYIILKNYYVENKVDILFKLNGSLLVTMIIALIFIFSSTVPVTNLISVDALDENDSNIVLEQKAFKSNSEEVIQKIDMRNMLCLTNTHFNSAIDVNYSNIYLHDSVRRMTELLMVISRESSIFEENLSDRIPDLIISGNLVTRINYLITWNHFTIYFTNINNIANLTFKLDCHKQGTLIYRKARAPSNIINNALTNNITLLCI